MLSSPTADARAIIFLISMLLVACHQDPFSAPLTLGAEVVSPEVLNRGYRVYAKHCVQCHGPFGRGDGALAASARPRDLGMGVFLYKSTPGEALPTHQDLIRTVSVGLPGTSMPSFLGALSDQELSDVVYFIKTLSKRWRNESVPPPLLIPPDPWASGQTAQAVEEGRKLYHGDAGCWRCHPAYVPEVLLSQWLGAPPLTPEKAKKEIKNRILLAPLDKPTPMHTPLGSMLPSLLLSANMRAGSTDADLYRTLSVGLPSVGMFALFERLSPSQIWSLIHYIRRLQSPSSRSQP